MKKIGLSVLMVAVLMLTGCATRSSAVYFDEKAIAAQNDTYVLTHWSTEREALTLTGWGVIAGALTLWSMNVEQETNVTIDTSFSVAAGRAKLVFIGPDGTVSTLLERTPNAPDSGDSVLTFTALPGMNRVKLVAENNTELTLRLAFSGGEVSP